MKNNFLNLQESDLDKPIYRVFSRKRFFEMCDGKKLTLVKPRLWDDPFENYILQSNGQLPDGKLFVTDQREKFYGQCWTKTIESDAIWRIYAPDKDGVKVATTPRKLLAAIFDQRDEYNTLNCFLGKVEYYTTDKLEEFSKKSEDIWTDSTNRLQASTLLLKRTPFKHEKEIRLLYHSTSVLSEDIIKFDINPNELFDSITFDPRIETYKKFKDDKLRLRKMGFNNKIIKSNLYETPNFTFQFRK